MKIDECEREAVEALLLLGEIRPPIHKKPRVSTAAHRLPPIAARITSAENGFSVFTPWGFRSMRSRYTGRFKRRQDEGPSVLAAGCSHRSPDTPLDNVADTDPSTSGSDEVLSSADLRPLKRFDAGEKANEVKRSPSVEVVITSSQPVIRLGRKKTLSDLHAEEKLLVDEKKKLGMLLESMRIEKELLVTENRRLLNVLTNSDKAPSEVQPTKSKFLLPDLNLPAAECLEPDCNLN